MTEEKKAMLTLAGFKREVQRVNEGKCPFCGKPVDSNSFRDELSRTEFEISGLCQNCQDKTFGE